VERSLKQRREMHTTLALIAHYSVDVLAMSCVCRSFNRALLSEEHMNLRFPLLEGNMGRRSLNTLLSWATVGEWMELVSRREMRLMRLRFVSSSDEARTKAIKEGLEILYCPDSKYQASGASSVVAEFHRCVNSTSFYCMSRKSDSSFWLTTEMTLSDTMRMMRIYIDGGARPKKRGHETQ
jgi:hypothetical protein